MSAVLKENVDYRLLDRLSDLVICSHCLQKGKVTPVPQVISDRHALTNRCGECRHEARNDETRQYPAGKVLSLRR